MTTTKPATLTTNDWSLSVTTPVASSQRYSLSLLVVLNAVFQALKPTLGHAFSAEGFAHLIGLIFQGQLLELRAAIAPLVPVTHTQAAVHAALGAIDAVIALGREEIPRRFRARVALNGHNDLGVCLVEEERLAGADVLRCTQLCAPSPTVHLIRASSIYQIVELTDDEARDVVAAWHHERAEEERERAEALARQRAARGKAIVDVQRVGQFVRITARVNGYPTPDALCDGEVSAALRAADFDGRPRYDQGRRVGLVDGYLSADDAEQAATLGSPLCEALGAAGFLSVTVLPAAAPEEQFEVAAEVTW